MKKKVDLRLSFPRPAQFALVAVGAVLVLLLGWMIVLGPKQKQISNLNSQAAAVRQQIADDLSRAATQRSTASAPTIKVADVYKLQTAMPSIVDMPDLLLELDQVAKAAGVTIQSLQPSAPSVGVGGDFSTVPIMLTAAGNFYSVTDLLYRLRNLVYVQGGALQANGRIFTVTAVTLTPSGSAITATIALTTYVYGSAAATSLLPQSTTTPSTDTTTTTSSSGPSAAGATP